MAANGSLMKYYDFSILHKFWALVDYEDDHINVLNQRENNRIQINFHSRQIANRSMLVKFIKEIAVVKQLDQLSIHLAVYILDVLMDVHDINNNRLKLVALASLLLAIKFEESDTQTLKASDLNIFVDNDYRLSDYHLMEIFILRFLKWNMNIPSVVHFVNIYLEFLFTEEEIANLCILKYADIWSDVRNYVKKYMDYVMDDITLMHEKPSKVAAAIMACTRSNLKFTEIYPSQLFIVSKYRLFELKILIGRLKNGVHDINCDE